MIFHIPQGIEFVKKYKCILLTLMPNSHEVLPANDFGCFSLPILYGHQSRIHAYVDAELSCQCDFFALILYQNL